ncbi:MAG: cobalamin-dependent protein [Acidimicrobiia bacterium]
MAAPEFPEIELALVSTAMAGDAGGLYRIASGLMDEGVPFDALLFDYLMETERSVGQRWAQADYLVAEEHAITAAIETVISLLTGMLDQPKDSPLVIVATAEGDDHSLPARAVAAHLLYLGYRTNFLGANVPAADLRDFLEIEPPVALVLSVAMTSHLLGARSDIGAAHEVGVPVLVGGKAFGDGGRWAPSIGADAWVANLRDVAGTVQRWADDGAPALGTAAEIQPELAQMLERRQAILARAAQELGAAAWPRMRDEAGLLLSAVEVALLTGDDQIVADMLDWQEASLTSHDLDPSTVRDAVATALGQFSEEGRAALSRAQTGH